MPRTGRRSFSCRHLVRVDPCDLVREVALRDGQGSLAPFSSNGPAVRPETLSRRYNVAWRGRPDTVDQGLLIAHGKENSAPRRNGATAHIAADLPAQIGLAAALSGILSRRIHCSFACRCRTACSVRAKGREVMTLADSTQVTREGIATVYERIRPHLRRTPVVRVDGAALGCRRGRSPSNWSCCSMRAPSSRAAHSRTCCCDPFPKRAWWRIRRQSWARGCVCGQEAEDERDHFVPSVAAATKCERIREYGAKLVVAGERYADALAASREFASESGALQVHAFDQPETLLGQGSVGARDRRGRSPGYPAGGGGRRRAHWRNRRLVRRQGTAHRRRAAYGANAVQCARGRTAGRCGGWRNRGRFSRTSSGGDLMFPLAQRYVERAVLVEDESIRDAQRVLWRAMRIATEPGGAAAMAALLSGAYRPRPRRARGCCPVRRQHRCGELLSAVCRLTTSARAMATPTLTSRVALAKVLAKPQEIP